MLRYRNKVAVIITGVKFMGSRYKWYVMKCAGAYNFKMLGYSSPVISTIRLARKVMTIFRETQEVIHYMQVWPNILFYNRK